VTTGVKFLQARYAAWHRTNTVKGLKANKTKKTVYTYLLTGWAKLNGASLHF